MRGRCLLLAGLPALGGCAAMGLAAVEVAVVGAAMLVPAAVASRHAPSDDVKVYGTYDTGFWFDRSLFSVWVVAPSAAQAEQVAQDTARQSCADRQGEVRIESTRAWQERALFVPVKVARFSYEMRFRCAAEAPATPAS